MSLLQRSFALVFTVVLSTNSFGIDDSGVASTKNENNNKNNKAVPNPHPLDAALEIAHDGLKRIEKISDYKAVLVRRERINGKLSNFEYLNLKIRNRDEEQNIPFSVYMRFTKPRSLNGRECIWVQGENNGKIVAHEAGLILGKITVFLNPTGPIAMKTNRYPIYEAGFKALVDKLIEKANREKKFAECEVNIVEGKSVAKRPAKMIEVIHPVQRDHFDFHIARIYIDKEYGLPVRYEAYTWPKSRDGKPLLLEQYLYTQIELNVGLTSDDFNPRSKQYNYCFANPPKNLTSDKGVKVASQKK